MIAIDTEKFIKKALQLIRNDKRSPLERGARKRPKMDFLNSISEVILELFDNLLSVSDQIYLINTINKKFSVTDTTYLKFVNEYLAEEYAFYRKNRVFAVSIHKIRNAITRYPASAKIQFSAVFGDSQDVSVDDYLTFLKTYYSESEKDFFNVRTVRKFDVIERRNVLRGNSGGPEDVVVAAKETLADIMPQLLKIKKVGKESPSKAPGEAEIAKAKVEQVKPIDDGSNAVDTVSSGNSEIKGRFKIYASHAERDVLKDAKGNLKVGVLPGAVVGEPKELFEIITNRDEFPEEIMTFKFLVGNYSQKTLMMDEPYVYLRDIDLIHYADPDTYGLMNGLLFVCGTAYGDSSGYGLYRYYEGKIYFIETLSFIHGNVTFQRDVREWQNKNTNIPFEDLGQAVLDLKSQKRREKLQSR